MKLDKIRNIMSSLCCNDKLLTNKAILYCEKCGGKIFKDNNSHIFRSEYEYINSLDHKKGLKYLLKKNQIIYKMSLYLLSPVYIVSPNLRKLFEKQIKNNDVILNIGSGNHVIHDDIINIDYNIYDNVDIVADTKCLPIKNNSVDCIISFASLEHIKESAKALSEFTRILKDDGRLFIYVPFLQPLHASPSDYRRWNINGLIEDLSIYKFTIIDYGIGAGPSSTVAWIISEYLAIILSFGQNIIYKYISMPLMVLCSPIKWFDIIINKYSNADVLASAVWIYAKK